MLKKVLALALALIMLLMPMTASAVSWSTIVASLNSTGSYSDGTTTATREGDVTTVTGGNVNFGHGMNEWIGQAGTYILSGITADLLVAGAVYDKDKDIRVILKDGSYVKEANFDAMGGSNSVTVENQSGMFEFAYISSYSGANTTFINGAAGKLDEFSVNSYDETGNSRVTVENEGSMTDVTLFGDVDYYNKATGVVDNMTMEAGSIEASQAAVMSAEPAAQADAEHSTHVYLKNEGTIGDLEAIWMSQGTIAIESTGTVTGNVSVKVQHDAQRDGDIPMEVIQEAVKQAVRISGISNETGVIECVIQSVKADGTTEDTVVEIEVEKTAEPEEEPYVEPDPIEVQRQLEGIGGVTTSPVWNWQGYLGHSSKPMWVYVNGEKTLMRQQLFWLGDSTKNHTCRINASEPDPASIELRVGLDMLRTAKRAEISMISILDSEENMVAQFAVSDLMAAFEQYGLVEGELLCVSANPDAEVMKVTLAGEYLPLEEKAE